MTKEEKIKAITRLQEFLGSLKYPMGICVAMTNNMWYGRFFHFGEEIIRALPPRRYKNSHPHAISSYSFPLTERGMEQRIQWLEDFKTKVEDG